MKNKEYYRPFELQSAFNFSFEDYLYLSEKYKNPIHFYSHYRRFLVVDDLFSFGSVHGVASYRGLVRLSSLDRTILIRNHVLNIKNCFLDAKDGIHQYQSLIELPFNGVLPVGLERGTDTREMFPDSNVRACVLPSMYANKSSSNENITDEIKQAYDLRHSKNDGHYCWNVQISDIVIPFDEAIWAKVALFGGSYADYESDSNKKQDKPQKSEKENLLHLTLANYIQLRRVQACGG